MSSHFTPTASEVFKGIKSLHKFQRLNDNARNALSGNYLWFSNLASFNDPFEGLYSYNALTDPELTFSNKFMYPDNKPDKEEIELRRLLQEDSRSFYAKIESFYREWYNEIATRVGNKGYFCFFSTPEFAPEDGSKKTPEDDMLMWGHYTNGLRGYRLNFRPERLLSGIGEDTDAYLIEYLKDPVPLQLDTIYHNYMVSPSSGRYRTSHEERMFRTKSIHWNYESELRLRREEVGKWSLPDESIYSVDFGDRMSDEEIAEVQQLVLVKNPKARFFRAVTSKTHFRIELIPQEDFINP